MRKEQRQVDRQHLLETLDRAQASRPPVLLLLLAGRQMLVVVVGPVVLLMRHIWREAVVARVDPIQHR